LVAARRLSAPGGRGRSVLVLDPARVGVSGRRKASQCKSQH
jgi:hypothetical protein